MKKTLFIFAILFLCTPAQAKELTVRAEVFATGVDHIMAHELFVEKEVPKKLYRQLSQLSRPISIVESHGTLDQNQVSSWLRQTISTYNKKSASKVTLSIPQQIKVHAYDLRVSQKILQMKIEKQVRTYCPTCEVELTMRGELPWLDDISPWTVRSKTDSWRGQQSARIIGKAEAFYVPVEVKWYDFVVTAASNIPVGKVIQKTHLKIERKDVTFANEPYLTSFETIVGMRSTKDFRRGQIIHRGGLKKINIVNYGQPMTATFAKGEYTITVNVLAKGTGAQGDTIPVMVNKTKKKLMAEIIDRDNVRIQ